jgi:predicted acylesterase/phospholipase RssA
MAEPLRVLTIDGGGMRGVYTAAFLNGLLDHFARERGVKALDLGRGFDLIVGTSTGAIIACAAAAGMPMVKVVDLYRENGPKIFPQRLRADARVIPQFWTRPKAIRDGADALREALVNAFGEVTFQDIRSQRGIALSIPAVEMSQERAWVFKTSHWGGHRDDRVTLVDACMATSAAPIYRSLAAIEADDGLDGYRVFCDGGLWANNPVMVGLLDALQMDPHSEIQIFSAGTVPRPNGETIPKGKLNRGLWGWKLGGRAMELSIAAQEFAFDNMARMFSDVITKLGRKVEVVRFPSGILQPSLLPHLDIDNASTDAIDALIGQARADVNIAKSACDDPNNSKGQLIRGLLSKLPEMIQGDGNA